MIITAKEAMGLTLEDSSELNIIFQEIKVAAGKGKLSITIDITQLNRIELTAKLKFLGYNFQLSPDYKDLEISWG